jgi:hypothetical protein
VRKVLCGHTVDLHHFLRLCKSMCLCMYVCMYVCMYDGTSFHKVASASKIGNGRKPGELTWIAYSIHNRKYRMYALLWNGQV